MPSFEPDGKFLVEIDPRNKEEPFILGQDLTYYGKDLTVTVPKGFQYDMASIPSFGRVLISKTDARIVRAATVHDYLYQNKIVKRRVADKIFHEIMKNDKMPWFKRGVSWLAVRLGGGLAWRD